MLGPLRLLARAAARTLCIATPLLAFGACASEGGRDDAPAEGAAVLSLAANVAIMVPATAAAATELRSGAHSVTFSLRGARAVTWRVDEGGWLAARAAPGGGDVRLRRRSGGVEDWVILPTPDEAPDALRYDVDLQGAAGLRAIGGVVEIVDAGGAPRLRIGPALLVDADGVTRAAALDVEGCAADRSAAPPWGRGVTAPSRSSGPGTPPPGWRAGARWWSGAR